MSLLFPPGFRAIDANGDPLPGALLDVYTTGTTTAASVYTTSALNVAHANPVVADAGGLFAPIYGDPTIVYRAILKDSSGATIQDIDPLFARNGGKFTIAGSTTGTTDGSGIISVAFPTVGGNPIFSSVPNVVVCNGDSAAGVNNFFIPVLASITTSGFNVKVVDTSASVVTAQPRRVNWSATGV